MKISVFGLPASGKSTFARQLADQMGVPCLDMDRVLFQSGKPLPLEQFRAEVGEFTASSAWVVEGNYSKLAGVTWDRSDVVVWLDFPLRVIYWRIFRRALRRAAGTEPKAGRGWKSFFSRRNLAWTVTRKYLRNRAGYRRQLSSASVAAPARQAPVQVFRFRSPRCAAQWLEAPGDLPHTKTTTRCRNTGPS